MKHTLLAFSFVVSLAPAWGQRWEMGIGAGGGMYTSLGATSAKGQTADAGLGRGNAVTMSLGQDVSRHFTGEIRYVWQNNPLRLKSGNQTVSFDSQSVAVSYNVLYNFGQPEDTFRPYVSLGSGMKYFNGKGAEVAAQPLSQFAYLTRTGEWKPMVAAGLGFRYRMSRNVSLRLEAQDQMSPVPLKLIAPAPGSTLNGWLHDFLVLGGISLLF
ncbi:MAG: outer membrane beta-barrel protein [Acidobacteria bacterium]|nr:outer membrane beta-barrel protein [Acidobacteriota bacterium]